MCLIADRASQSGIRFRRLPIGPHIRAAPAASLAGKPRLEIGQPDVIRPSVGADRCVVAATIIGTVDQETANASGAHFGEGDFLLSRGEGGHAPLKRQQVHMIKLTTETPPDRRRKFTVIDGGETLDSRYFYHTCCRINTMVT
jgi:hypothetical protein